MNDRHLMRAKFCQWIGFWWLITARDTRAPLVDTSARLQFFSLVALLIFVLPPEGYMPWQEGLTNAWRALQALLYALPIFVLLNAFIAVFKATAKQRQLGLWVGNRFVLHRPQHLMTAVVTDADNGKLTPFKVTSLPKNASVELVLEIEKGFDDRNIKVQFVIRKDQPIMWDQYERHTMVAFIPDDKTFYVSTLKPTPSNPTTIKVYLLSWYAPA